MTRMNKSRTLWAALAVICLLAFLLPLTVQAATLRVGSWGDEVKTLQTKLKRWGYYDGSIDGIFGNGTKEAVMYFQRTNGLTPDGIVGPATAKALGMDASGGSSSGQQEDQNNNSSNDNDLYLLARLVYGEARGEPYKGQVAVAAVVLNRVESSEFPNSVSGVIYQSGAFDVVADGQINLSPDETAIKAARDAMNGWDPTGGCLFYYNPATSTNQWMLSKPVLLTIGNHSFFK